MSANSSRAFSLAVSLRPEIHARNLKLLEYAKKRGAEARVGEYEDVLNEGCASVTMSVRACVYFIQTQRWMNVYEYVADRNSGATGNVLEDKIREALGDWYDQRCRVEDILCFERDAHYTALNVGGSGPERYGKCCALLDETRLASDATCFVGDSLRRVFSGDGQQRLTEDETLARFGPRDELAKLASVHSQRPLSSTPKIISVRDVRHQIESPDGVLEVHVHGPILMSHVKSIVMEERVYNDLWYKSQEYERCNQRERKVQHFDEVRSFRKLMQLRKNNLLPCKFRLVER